MQIYKKVFTLLLIVSIAVPFESCRKQVAPTPVQGVPGLSKRDYKRKERERRRLAAQGAKETERLNRKANRNLERARGGALKERERLKQEHIKRQTPEAQKRMQESQREADNWNEGNRRKKSFWERVLFWKKKKYKPHGSR